MNTSPGWSRYATRHPSPQGLAAVAGVLRFSPNDHMQLRQLAKATNGAVCPAAEAPASSVRPTVRALLDLLEPAPALVVNRLGDVLAVTTGYERLARPLGLLDGRRI